MANNISFEELKAKAKQTVKQSGSQNNSYSGQTILMADKLRQDIEERRQRLQPKQQLTPQQILQKGRERSSVVNSQLEPIKKAQAADRARYANTDLAALKKEIDTYSSAVDVYNNWEMPVLSQTKPDGTKYSSYDITDAKKKRDAYIAEMTGGLDIKEIRKRLEEKTREYNKAYAVQAPKIQAEEFYNTWELENYSDGKAKSGLDAFYAMKSQTEKAKKDKSFLERVGESMAYTPQTDFDLSPVIRAYEEDTTYKEPNDEWGQEQLNIFGYLYSFNKEKAYEYAIQVNDSINKAKEDEAKGKIRNSATDNVLSGGANWLGAVATAPLGLADWLDAVIETSVRGSTTNKGTLTPHDYSQTVTEAQTEALNEWSGTLPSNIPVIGGKGAGDVYGLATSMVQSSLSAATGEPLTAAISFFGSTSASAMKEARDKGATDEQAVLYGFAAGLAEAIPEMLAVDKLLNLKSSDTILKKLNSQGLTEGLTEGMTAVLTQVSDNIINGDFSEYNTLKAQYIKEGLAESDAAKKAWSDIAEEIAFDTLAGYAMGGIQAAPVAVSQAVQNNKTNIADKMSNIVDTAAKGSAQNGIDGIVNLSAADAKVDAVQKSINNVTGYKELTADQKQLRQLGQTYGVKVKFENLTQRTVDKNGVEQIFSPEGQYDPDTNTITLNTDVRPEHRPALFILKHELTHSMEKAGVDFERFMGSVEINEAFEEYAKSRTNSQTGEKYNSVDEWYNDIIYKYKKAGKTLGGNGISETTAAKMEAVADFVGDCLFGGNNAATEKLLKGLKGEERNKFVALVKKIIAKLKEFFGGTDKLTEIERLENEFLEVANKVAKMNATEAEQQKTTTEKGSGVKYSIAEQKYAEYNKPITLEDVKILRSISRKSINDFTQEDIEKSQKWAYKLYQQLGIKSPFFRRWFGDWRKYDNSTNINLVDTKKDNRRTVKNTYTGWNIQTSNKVHKETLHHLGSSEENAVKYLPYIDDITEKSILFDTQISDNDNENSLFFHTLYAYTEVLGYPALLKLQVEELYYYNRETSGTLMRDYILQNIKEESISERNRLSTPNHSKKNSSIISIADLFNLVKQYDNSFSPKPVDEHLVNEDGTPKKFYHGTNEKFDVFSPEELSPREGSFFFAENKEDAQGYGDNVYEVYLTGNKFADYDNQPSEFYQLRDKRKQVEYLKERGYDGWYSDIDSGGWAEFSVFSNNQIKSATENIGTFDKESNTRYSLPENPTPEQIGQALLDGEITMDEYNKLINKAFNKTTVQAGAIDQGEMVAPPNKPNPTPVSVKPGTKVSEHVRTILESGYASKDMESHLKENVLKGLGSFVPTSNKKNIDRVVKEVQTQGYQNALHTWRTKLSSSTVTAGTVAKGEALLRLAMEQNNAVDIINISADLAELSTRTAQSLQAFSLLKRMGGLGQLVYIQRSVNRINDDLQRRYKNSKKEAPVVKVDKKLAERLAKTETEGEYQVLYAKIIQDVASQVPSTFLDKWNAWRYMSMLVNPTTHFRNILGNAIFLPTVRMKDVLAVVGERFIKEEDRTKVLKVKKDYQNFADKDFTEVEPLLTGTGKYNPTDNIRDQQTIFKTKALEGLRKLNFGALEYEDKLFLRKHYRHALGSFLQARNIDLNTITSEQLTEARNYAFSEALKATYRDASLIANMVSRLSKVNGFSNVLVEGILPFKKTPINVLKRGMEYSPIGFIKTMSYGLWQLKHKEITISQFIDGLASSITGSGILAIGYWLASLGIVKGGFDDEEEFDRLMGKQEYSVQIGDKSYTVDWAAPASIPFFMGVAFSEYKAEDGDWLSNLYKFGLKGFEPILNLSMLAGLNDVISSVAYADDAENIPQLIGTAAGSYFSQALPTIFSKTTNLFDDTRRTKYIDKTSNMPEIFQSALDKIQSKVPGLSQNRAKYVDAWGETKYTGNFIERFFQQFVSPGYASTVNESEINEETLRLYRETGEKSVMPSTPARYFMLKGNRRDLSKEEYFEYATLRGQMQAELVDEAIHSKEYAKLSDEQKTKVISDIYAFTNAYAKTTLSYSYEEVAAMQGGTDVFSTDKWSRLNDKAKRLLVNDYFFDNTEAKAYSNYQKGKSVSEIFIKKVLEDGRK